MTLRSALVILGMALAVWLPKGLPLLLVSDRLSPQVQVWLRYVAPAVLAAMVAPAILAPDTQLTFGWFQLPFAITLAVAVWTRRIFPPLVAGLLTVWMLTW